MSVSPQRPLVELRVKGPEGPQVVKRGWAKQVRQGHNGWVTTTGHCLGRVMAHCWYQSPLLFLLHLHELGVWGRS